MRSTVSNKSLRRIEGDQNRKSLLAILDSDPIRVLCLYRYSEEIARNER